MATSQLTFLQRREWSWRTTERTTCLSPSDRYKAPWRNRRTREQKAGGRIQRLPILKNYMQRAQR